MQTVHKPTPTGTYQNNPDQGSSEACSVSNNGSEPAGHVPGASGSTVDGTLDNPIGAGSTATGGR